jgi:hypothetical protein
MSYERKYLKYKNKYLSLKNSYLLQMGGGLQVGDIVSLNSNSIIKGTIVKTIDSDNWADMIGYNGKKYSESLNNLTKIRDPLKVGDTVQLLDSSTPPGVIRSIDENKIQCVMKNSVDDFPTTIYKLIKPENMSDYTNMKNFDSGILEDEFKIGTKVQLIKDHSVKGIITKKDGNNITILSKNNQAYSGDKSKFLRSNKEIIIDKSPSLKKGNLVKSLKYPFIIGKVADINLKNKHDVNIEVRDIKTNESHYGFAHNFEKVEEPIMV